ncbi:MAG TPA: hypothetical protein DCE41_01110 [Cytophagales bacterium]|nr:hypothetical protein [Cytophagales bacterium]HAA21053.1 hypothetical protein [Cytophagales bacterium]HAP60777.1 hypothetical protein [Cytophagales bacterium]
MWNPGLDNNDRTLIEVYNNFFNRYHQNDIPWQVKWVENPAYWCSLKGSVDLFSHDCIHILLGIGNRPEEETFVIGMTMGSHPKLGKWEINIYRILSQYFYPKEYKFTRQHLDMYDIGISTARAMGIMNLSTMDFRKCKGWNLGDLRKEIKVNVNTLKDIYSKYYPSRSM